MANENKVPKAKNALIDMTVGEEARGNKTIEQIKAKNIRRRATLRKQKVKNVTLDNIEASKKIIADKIYNARDQEEIVKPELEAYADFLDDVAGKYSKTQKRRIPPANPKLPKDLVLNRLKARKANAERLFEKLDDLKQHGRKKLSPDMLDTLDKAEKDIIRFEAEIVELETPKVAPEEPATAE